LNLNSIATRTYTGLKQTCSPPPACDFCCYCSSTCKFI